MCICTFQLHELINLTYSSWILCHFLFTPTQNNSQHHCYKHHTIPAEIRDWLDDLEKKYNELITSNHSKFTTLNQELSETKKKIALIDKVVAELEEDNDFLNKFVTWIDTQEKKRWAK